MEMKFLSDISSFTTKEIEMNKIESILNFFSICSHIDLCLKSLGVRVRVFIQVAIQMALEKTCTKYPKCAQLWARLAVI